MHALRQSHSRGELRYLAWIPGVQNYADAMTKDIGNPSQYPLWELLNTNKIRIDPQGWIERNDSTSFQKENSCVLNPTNLLRFLLDVITRDGTISRTDI